MINVASFSGGRTSAYLASMLLDKFGREQCRFVFMDTGAEHPATYDFIRRVDAHYGLDLVCLRGEFDPRMGIGVRPRVVSVDEIGPDLAPIRSLCGKYGTMTAKTPACTSRLKDRVFTRWCNDTFGRGEYVTWLGIRADEPKRLKHLGKSPLLRYLAEISDAEKADVLEFWAAMPFDLEISEHLGNCVFCVKKSSLKLALAMRDEPGAAAEWIEMLRQAPDRTKLDGLTSENVYRGQRTLAQIAGMYADADTESLRGRMRATRATDAGSCSESCEPEFGRQVGLFG